jgi:hypothetical protein
MDERSKITTRLGEKFSVAMAATVDLTACNHSIG